MWLEGMMKVFAIGDLHLSTAVDKPMNVFGDNWLNHEEKIFKDWDEKVSDDDIVFIVGDISWASKLNDAKLDLDKINAQKGKKIFIKGNHDYWWTTATALNKLYDDSMVFMNTNYVMIGEYAVCSTRGWSTPNDIDFDEKDNEIYLREAHRLKISLEQAKKDGHEKIIILLHYPPTNEDLEKNLFFDLIEEYKPEHVIYGHLHGEESFQYGVKGCRNGINYHLVSCDYLGFELKEIMEIESSEDKKTIGIDIDGTLIDPYFFIPYLNKLLGQNMTIDRYTSINWNDTYGPEHQDVYKDFDIKYTYVYKEAELLPGAKETIDELIENGNKIFYITARDVRIEDVTKKWMSDNGLDSNAVFSIGSKRKKAEIASKLKCEWIIEDDPYNAEMLLDAGFKVILFDTNYNQWVTNNGNLYRVQNWKEVLNLLKKGLSCSQ